MQEQVLLTGTAASKVPMQDQVYPGEQQPQESSCWSREKCEDEGAGEGKCYMLTAIPHSPYPCTTQGWGTVEALGMQEGS